MEADAPGVPLIRRVRAWVPAPNSPGGAAMSDSTSLCFVEIKAEAASKVTPEDDTRPVDAVLSL